MKKYLKENIKNLPFILIAFIMFYSITTLATNYLFNSNEVSYDNTETSLHADEVQGAIDEVFQHATDYSELKNKIGNSALTTTSQTLTSGINELNNDKINTSSVANNLTTTTEGLVLDARQGKILNDKLSGIENNATKETSVFWLGSNSATNKAFVTWVLNAVCASSSIPTGKLVGVSFSQTGWATYMGICYKSSSTEARCYIFDDDSRVYIGRRTGSTYYAAKLATSSIS